MPRIAEDFHILTWYLKHAAGRPPNMAFLEIYIPYLAVKRIRDFKKFSANGQSIWLLISFMEPWKTYFVCIGLLALLFMLFGTLTIVVFIRVYLYVIKVEGQSMSPTLNNMDRILVLRHWPHCWLKKGQIVIGRFWDIPPDSIISSDIQIKRIIGLPGDIVTANTYQINNYTISTGANYDDRVWHVPENHLFLRGDNRLESLDSLVWGPVPFDTYIGIMIAKLPRSGHISKNTP